MSIRLHRSPIFWGGIVMMISFFWAARDSWRRESGGHAARFTCKSACGGLVFMHSAGGWAGQEVFRHDSLPRLRRKLEGPFFLHSEGGEESPAEVADQSYESYSDYCREQTIPSRSAAWLLYVPYWLLGTVAAVLWLSLLTWIQLRAGKAAKAIEEG